jgi:hypothetical protein
MTLKIHFFIFVLLTAMLSSCTAYTCEDFKLGEYAYAEEAYKHVKIIRTASEQKEFQVRDGKQVEDTYSISWDGPCSYTLVFKATNSEVDQFHTQYDTIRVRIQEITNDGYVFETFLNGKNPRGEFIKIN